MIGIGDRQHVALGEVEGEVVEQAAHTGAHREQMARLLLALDGQGEVAREQRGGERLLLGDARRARGPAQTLAHLSGDSGEFRIENLRPNHVARVA